MKTANFTIEALEAATTEQLGAVAWLLRPDSTGGIAVTKGGFDLPDGYLAFRLDYADSGNGRATYGGIDSEGSVST